MATSPRGRGSRRQLGMAALTLGALGVVFGDIGTSPLYSLQTLFSADHGAVKPTEADVFGVISLVFWAITLIVSIEFVLFIMRADNEGEGGVLALIAKIETTKLDSPKLKFALVAVGMFGVALFYGDGMITPAISVLSAVEGVKVVEPSIHEIVVPATIAILVVVFAIQRFGTHRIGRVFGPLMVLWFVVIAVAGLGRIVDHPEIIKALSPSYGIEFFGRHFGVAFISLGAVVLAITGAEALYADMGHFGRPPIKRAWFFIVFPALTLNYLGQGSLIVSDPSAISNPFFLLIPHWGRVPMVVLATVATVIASQAVISGAFSVTKQAIQLGFLPRLQIRHTSADEIGQVYLPAVNWFLLITVVALVIGFGSSTALGSAYGIAVTCTITADTLLFLVIARALWKKPRWMVGVFAAVFFTVDLAFLAANLTKTAHGGWFPLSVGVVLFAVLSTWRRGTREIRDSRVEAEGSLQSFVDELHAADPPAAADPGHGRLPQRAARDDPARPPRELRTRPRPAPVDRDHLDRNDPHPLRLRRGAPGRRPARLRGRRHLPPDREGRLPGSDQGPAHLRPGLHPRPRGRRPRGGRRLLPLAGDAASRQPARGHEAVAQAALRRARPQRLQPRRLLPPAGRPHGHDRLRHRPLVRFGFKNKGF